MRGPGDLFGIRQSGQFRFRLGDIYQDASILQDAQECATALYRRYNDKEQMLSVEERKFWEYYNENIATSVDFINI